MRSPTQKCSHRLGLPSRQMKTPSILRIGSITWAIWPGPREEMLLDEAIAVGEEDPEIGMRVIPADDRQVGELRVHLGVDLRPGLVGEGHLGEPGLAPSPRIDSTILTNGPTSSRCQVPTSTPQISTVVSARRASRAPDGPRA